MIDQLVLPLEARSASDRSDFIVSGCNRPAVETIDLWPRWPASAMALTGSPASGKSHLAGIWAGQVGELMHVFSADLKGAAEALAAAPRHMLLEANQPPHDETALFHLLNLTAQTGKNMLIVARNAPATWPINLPDLSSRLAAVPVVEIGAPDDDLFVGVMQKHFRDRQVDVDEGVFEFLLTRTERSFGAISRMVQQLDHLALSRHASITRHFAARALRDGMLMD